MADVVLRTTQSPMHIIGRLIRFATRSRWSHAALVLLLSNSRQGYDSTFLIEAITKGIRVVAWSKVLTPYQEVTIRVKRLKMDWYVETTYERERHTTHDPEDTHGLYDRKVVYELTALYAKRVLRRHLKAFPVFAHLAASLANFFRTWSLDTSSSDTLENFICSGLIQYSFFEALRERILHDLTKAEDRETVMQNLHHVIFCDDPDGVIAEYVWQIQVGKRNLDDPIPGAVLDLLKTALPADFNNSLDLQWCYIIHQGKVWQIDDVAEGYRPQSEEEAFVLDLLKPEHWKAPRKKHERDKELGV
ncbi:MAG: hypothetical protein NVS4B11_05390 [Ktedonobacteraceae bacterium]